MGIHNGSRWCRMVYGSLWSNAALERIGFRGRKSDSQGNVDSRRKKEMVFVKKNNASILFVKTMRQFWGIFGSFLFCAKILKSWEIAAKPVFREKSWSGLTSYLNCQSRKLVKWAPNPVYSLASVPDYFLLFSWS